MNLIFLLPAAADLARASTACVSFRRVITAHSFLRRFRTLHPPPLLGMLCGGLTIAQPPHPSAAAAATLADVDFSCPFLPPSPDRWCRRGVRDGRALFSPRLQGNRAVRNPRDLVTEFAVCDPLHHRYLLLPALPGHLAGQVHPPDILECEPFLAPPGHDEDSSFRDFRVMCLVRCTTKLVLFVFFSCAGQWLTDRITSDVFGCGASDRYYANECFCWHAYYDDDDVEMLLLLDARRMEFSVVDLPPPHCMRQVAIVEAGEGRLGMLTVDGTKHPAHRLLYAVHSQDGNGANQWQSRSVFPLPENYRYYIRGVAGGYLLLAGYPEDNRRIADYFSLDLQTFQVEWFCQTGYYVMNGHLYADLPPSLSPPTL